MRRDAGNPDSTDGTDLLDLLIAQERAIEAELLAARAEAEAIVEGARAEAERIVAQARQERARRAEAARRARAEAAQRTRERRIAELDRMGRRLDALGDAELRGLARELLLELFPELGASPGGPRHRDEPGP